MCFAFRFCLRLSLCLGICLCFSFCLGFRISIGLRFCFGLSKRGNPDLGSQVQILRLKVSLSACCRPTGSERLCRRLHICIGRRLALSSCLSVGCGSSVCLRRSLSIRIGHAVALSCRLREALTHGAGRQSWLAWLGEDLDGCLGLGS